ncbi:MAG TPA: biotin/lipoyl-binding protein, partial [Blastocatellia bacterium]
MFKIGLKIIPFALVLLISACSRGKSEQAANANNREQAAPQVIEVSTAQVVERNMRRSLEVVGSLDAQDDVTVSSQLSGNLDNITIDVGSVVRQGQVIARLDPRELRFRAEQQEAALRQAEAKLS